MPIKLKAPLLEEFELKEIDEMYESEGESTLVTIRQATQREHELRAVVFNRITRQYTQLGEGTVREVQEIPWTELARKEVYLTLAGCNIEDQEGKQLFRFNKENRLAMKELDFRNAWGMLDPSVCREIHKSVLKVNFVWDSTPEPTGDEDLLEASKDGAGSSENVPLEEVG